MADTIEARGSVKRRGFWAELFWCWLLEKHENRRADAWGWRPLFPVVCDHCTELFYMPQWTDDERAAHAGDSK